MSKHRLNPGVEKDKFFKRSQPNQKNNRRSADAGENFGKYKKNQQESQTKGENGKTFDKKTYRLKKYSNKYKLDKWEENRRKTVLKKYYKDLKSDPQYGNYKPFNFDEALSDSGDDDESQPKKSGNEEHFTVQNKTENAVKEDEQKLNYVMHPDIVERLKQKEKPFWKAKQELNRLKEDKKAKKEAAAKAKEEKAQALAAYKQNKAEKFKKLSKKTRKGQPVMKDRMQMLLENIQKNIHS